MYKMTEENKPQSPTNSVRQPYCCPVCAGKGIVPSGFYDYTHYPSWTKSDATPERCRTCGGIGIVWG